MHLFQLQELHSAECDSEMHINAKQVQIMQEGNAAHFKALSRNLPTGTEENLLKSLVQYKRYPG